MAIDITGSVLLFIGEGNFSFSAALSASPEFHSLKCQLIATDYIPELEREMIQESNSTGDSRKASFSLTVLKENVNTLKSRGHPVLYDVDAKRLHDHSDILNLLKNTSGEASNIFVIFNFPHVKSKKMKIGLNRDLLRDFFISCDKLAHCLNNDNQNETDNDCFVDSSVSVIPVVSLCAGQSGIAEVESVSRSWGDSWQINDMAAHGNFVCTSISKFTDWKLSSIAYSDSSRGEDNLSKPSYQSSYYRLQTGVSFTTENALTLTYQHSRYIDPRNTDRLKSILRFASPQKGDDGDVDKVVSDFSRYFDSISHEGVIFSSPDNSNQRPYHHVVHCRKDVTKILNYVNGSEENDRAMQTSVEITENLLKVKTIEADNNIVITVAGTDNDNDDDVMVLYVDRLLELKYNCDYRLLLSNNGCAKEESTRKSLYPHTHEFHISFWVKDDDDGENDSLKAKFSRDSFVRTLLDVYGLMLKDLELVEEYVDDKQNKKSLCWRVKVQSLDSALSRLTAHQMYLQLRNELTERLYVEVR